MATYKYTIRLTSDAEPGTGLGGEVLNDLIPRDHEARPTLRASHVKGLMRQAYVDIARRLGWDKELESRVFGDREETRAVDAAFRITDATAVSPPETSVVTRTAVEDGIAKDASLRTTEAVPVETVFAGRIHSHAESGSVEDLAWRMSLLAIEAVGASRTRGCGACVVSIEANGDDQKVRPGDLLKQLHEKLREPNWKEQGSPEQSVVPAGDFGSNVPVILRLTVEAETPICCPEIPDKTNVISSGFSIPASAVQGVILHRLDAESSVLADRCFESPNFRAWPLLPCSYLDKRREPYSRDKLRAAIRVSLTHRVAKFSAGKKLRADDFQDAAIEPYQWQKVTEGAPLKAADGVLLRFSGNESDVVHLWRAADMPHSISSHGVHNDPETENGRNLFSVDAMAPLRWQGIVVMPEYAAEHLLESLKADPVVAVGKSRTVRGIGKMRAERVDGTPPEWQGSEHEPNHTVLVVQSPLLISPTTSPDRSAEDELKQVLMDWAVRNELTDVGIRGAWANVGIRFGWNRTVQQGRLDARRVALPGSVIAFDSRLDDQRLAGALQAGVGEGRKRGYGAVSVHPGKASDLYRRGRQARAVEGPDQLQEAVRLALDMHAAAEGRLPSPSQIRAIQQRLDKGDKAGAKRYFDRQVDERTSRIWHTWQPIHEQMEQLLGDRFNTEAASRALAVLSNLAITDGELK